MNHLSIIIPSKNAANFTACAAAIRAAGERHRIIVIDDGLDPCVLCDLDPAWRLVGEKPFIFSRNINAGIRRAGSDDVILMNDDALLETQVGFTALQQLEWSTPGYGLLSATTNNTGNPAQTRRSCAPDGIRDEPRTLPFVCVYIPRRTIKLVGMLDERFTAYGWEDNDYCRRVRNAGLKLGIFDGCFVDHSSLRSTFRGDPFAPGDIAPGAAIYFRKWGDLL